MIRGAGTIITTNDEEGNPIPFLTTDEILKQIMKFGFYVEYDEKENLPSNVITLLQTVYELGYDKITAVLVKEYTKSRASVSYRPKVIVMKSEFNTDILKFGCKITDVVFKKKLADNTIMNVTNEPDISWSWLNYIANISDLLDEQLDPPVEQKPYIPKPPFLPSSVYQDEDELTPYVDDDSEESEPLNPYVDDVYSHEEEDDEDGVE